MGPPATRSTSKCNNAQVKPGARPRGSRARNGAGGHRPGATLPYGLNPLKPAPTPWPQVYLCVALTTLATLLLELSLTRIFSVVFYYHFAFLAIFVSGAIVSLAIGETITHVHRVYFFDLMGAAAGCLLLYPLLNGFGGVSAVLGAAITFAVAAAIWHSVSGSVRGRVGSVALALALVAFLIVNQRYHIIDIRHAKGQTISHEIFQHWNVFSRIGLVDRSSEGRYSIVIDADAATDIATFDFDHLTAGQRRDLMDQGPALPYALRPGGKTLIIGPGGGWDVARALAYGSHDITGVEINPIIATTIMQERFPALSHGLYLRPDADISPSG